MGSSDLFDAMQEFFDVCMTALEDTPDGAPRCGYVCAGPPAWDLFPCLIVYSGGPAIADTFPLQPSLAPGHRVTVTGEVNIVSITALVLRCAVLLPEDGIPGNDWPDQQARAARQTSADLWAIWNHVRQAKSSGALFAPREREFFFDPAVAVNQQGGACGWQITVRTALDGYRVGP